MNNRNSDELDRIPGLEIKIDELREERARLREVLKLVLSWENFDFEYAGEVEIREHREDFAQAREVLESGE